MKLQKESLWILLALIVSPFYFVYRETRNARSQGRGGACVQDSVVV